VPQCYVVRALLVMLEFNIHNGIPSNFFRDVLGLRDLTIGFRIYFEFHFSDFNNQKFMVNYGSLHLRMEIL